MLLSGVATAGTRYELLIEPTYSICAAGQACSSAARTTLTLKYKPVTTAKHNVRFELSRAYLQSGEEENGDTIDVVGGKSYQAATDVLFVKFGNFSDGYERSNWKFGYSYQHSIAGSTAFHTPYGEYNFFFGRQIKRGSAGPAHQFDVLVKVLRNTYQPNTLLPQDFFLVATAATFPFDPEGRSRLTISYTAQQKFAGAGRLSPFSSLAFARFSRNFTRSIRGWTRIDWRTLSAPVVQQTATVTVGLEFTL
jgi:hypothetical protein